MYGLLVTATGWSYEHIDDNLTLPIFDELSAYWSRHPPTHVLVAGLFDSKAARHGYQAAPAARPPLSFDQPPPLKETGDAGTLAEFLSVCGMLGIPVNRVRKDPTEPSI